MGFAELARLIKKHAHADGTTPTAIPFLSLLRASKPTPLRSGILEPSICLVVEGDKRLLVGREAHRYGAGSYCMSALEFPTAGKVVTAPYHAIRIVLDVREIVRIILDEQIEPGPAPRGPAVFVAAADERMLQCMQRLLDLLDEPDAPAFLAEAAKREIIYRLLKSPGGPLIVRSVKPANLGVGRAVDWLRRHFDRPMDIDALARASRMSVSALRHEFKATTALAPLQFQKHLRLQEARRLLLAGEVDAGTAAFRVGYESPSQFSREYRRMYGAPPIRDIQKLELVS
jgi:AraC-like DNA-binding protein